MRRSANGLPDLAAAAQRWETIRIAIGSWGKTVRLCLILLTVSLPADALIWLIHR